MFKLKTRKFLNVYEFSKYEENIDAVLIFCLFQILFLLFIDNNSKIRDKNINYRIFLSFSRKRFIGNF